MKMEKREKKGQTKRQRNGIPNIQERHREKEKKKRKRRKTTQKENREKKREAKTRKISHKKGQEAEKRSNPPPSPPDQEKVKGHTLTRSEMRTILSSPANQETNKLLTLFPLKQPRFSSIGVFCV